MKKEYPVLYARVSTAIGTPIILITLLVYVQRVITQPASTVYPLAITAFGIPAALSGICFRMASSLPEDSTPRYAGEKFLHSTLLLIQSLFLIYVKDTIISFGWVASHETITTVISAVAAGVFSLLSGAAAICWYHGFSELNKELWRNWKRRIEAVNKTQEEPVRKKPGKQKTA